jgi:hypothetical protein
VSTRFAYRLELPLRTRNTSNEREHWAAKAKRAKLERMAVGLKLAAEGKAFRSAVHTVLSGRRPHRVVVLLTRVAPKAFDSHDNLRVSFKATVDAIAEWLGLDDADERFDWRYSQEPSAPKTCAVRIHMELMPEGEPQ